MQEYSKQEKAWEGQCKLCKLQEVGEELSSVKLQLISCLECKTVVLDTVWLLECFEVFQAETRMSFKPECLKLHVSYLKWDIL